MSERKLNSDDIADLSKDKIELLRNMIFARYGYRFNRDDLYRFFSQFNWYHPQYDDAGYIYERFSEIEKYNVEFLKAHE